MHGDADDVWGRAEITFAELAERERAAGDEREEPQVRPFTPAPHDPIPHDLPVPPDPPADGAPSDAPPISPSGTSPAAVDGEPRDGPGGLTVAPILDESPAAVDYDSLDPARRGGRPRPPTISSPLTMASSVSRTRPARRLAARRSTRSGEQPPVVAPRSIQRSCSTVHGGRWVITSCMDAQVPTSALLLGVSAQTDPILRGPGASSWSRSTPQTAPGPTTRASA